jgi:hypothetical protein
VPETCRERMRYVKALAKILGFRESDNDTIFGVGCVGNNGILLH